MGLVARDSNAIADRVFIAETGAVSRDRLSGAIFGLVMVLFAALLLWGIEALTGFRRWLWLAALAVIPLCGEGLSWVTQRGVVAVKARQVVVRRWWRERRFSSNDLQEVSRHGPRVIISVRTGETIFLEWPWYLSKEAREQRAAAMCAAIKELQS
jgi:hypothetical protein